MHIKTDLTDEQQTTLQRLFRRKCVEPHVVAQQLHIKRNEAIALLDGLVEEYPSYFSRKYLIYHTCSEAPVGALPYTKTLSRGWVCPQCEEEVELNELTLDFVYEAIATVDIWSLENGLVRYWAIESFPFHTKNPPQRYVEPSLMLPKKASEVFDGIIERGMVSREKALARVDQDLFTSIQAIVKDLTE